MEIKMMDIHSLKDYADNPRNNEGAIDYVKQSIKEFGFKVPIVVDKDNEIIAGHTRKKAALEIGIKEVPVIVADDLSDEQVRAFRLADNKVAEFSEWDMELLQSELNMLEEMDMDDFGFDLSEDIDEVEVEEDDFDEEPPEDPIAEVGQIYQLGRHRVMCGDSTSDEDVEKLMNGNKAEMVFTDPPYLMNFSGSVHADGSKSSNSSYGNIKNDSMSREDGNDFIYNIVRMIKTHTRGAYYICFYRLGLDYVFRALERNNNQYKALIIWDKGNHTLSNSDYMSKYEPIVYGWINDHNFYGPKAEFDIWEVARTQHNNLHPTMKPLKLVERAVNNSSREKDIVLDLFGGSGSTLMACEQTGREAYLMELDPKYVDVIINRWEQYTGEEAVLVNG